MTVFIVKEWEMWEGSHIVKIFDSREKAVKYIADVVAKDSPNDWAILEDGSAEYGEAPYNDGARVITAARHGFSIDEYEVN